MSLSIAYNPIVWGILICLASVGFAEPPSSGYGAPPSGYSKGPSSGGYDNSGGGGYGNSGGSYNGNSHHYQENYPPRPYKFNYAVNDHYSGANFKQQENSDGNRVNGQYTVLLPDGRTQIVTYNADWKNGFNAEVTYQGEARYPEPQKGGYGPPQQNYGPPSPPAQSYSPPAHTYSPPSPSYGSPGPSGGYSG